MFVYNSLMSLLKASLLAEDRLIEIEAELRRLSAERARLLVELDQSARCPREYGHTTAGWYTHQTKRSPIEASQHLRQAHRLHEEFPELLAALERQRIGTHHVAAFLRAANHRNANALREFIAPLIDLAQIATYPRWEAELRGIAAALDETGGYDPAEDPDGNHIQLTRTFQGILHVKGQLVGELALKLESLLTAHTARMRRRYQTDSEATNGEVAIPRRSRLAAEALVELVDIGAAAKPASSSHSEVDITVTYNTETQTLTDNSTSTTLSQTLLPWLLAAAQIQPLAVNATNDPLFAGHRRRYANRQQRQALAVRDGGCTFPGCTNTPNACDAHHIRPWNKRAPTDGGPTDITNLTLLCRHHHRITHQPGWHMQHCNDPTHPHTTAFTWRTPKGQIIYSQRHGAPLSNACFRS
jgi:hypothetical protein